VIDFGDLSGDEVDPAEGYDAIMSSGPSYDASSQFGMLSELLTTGYQGSGNTLEDLVRELLKPMLRSWLDDNLPPLVERMVAKEIARLARVKKP
jgi:cell pole-organizing protein PopZ